MKVPLLRNLFRLILLAAIVACSTASHQKTVSLPPLHLVLGLDGVGYETMKRLYDGGYFRNFNQPSQMVASFPSLSDPNWARLMRAPVSESYTKAFFDIKQKTKSGQGRPFGSLINHILVPPPYEGGFDFRAEGAFQHLAIMTWTQTSGLYWLDALEKNITATRDKETFFAFIMNTDIIAHVMGEQGLLEYLGEVDKRLRRLRQKFLDDFGYELHITLVSDHGNHWAKPLAIEFEAPLEKKGWKFEESLKTSSDVAFVAPEIIAFAAFYCLPGQEKKLANDLSTIDGVHVALYLKEPNHIMGYANGGKDVFEIFVSPDKQTVSYKVLKGKDPLDQELYFKSTAAKTSHALDFREYFSLSSKSDYPYAAVRIWEGFTRNAVTAGSVLVSPKLGRVFANKTLQMLTALRGLESTHGGLHRIETNGVVMSTQFLTAPIRPDDFGDLVDLSRYQRNLERSQQKVSTLTE